MVILIRLATLVPLSPTPDIVAAIVAVRELEGTQSPTWPDGRRLLDVGAYPCDEAVLTASSVCGLRRIAGLCSLRSPVGTRIPLWLALPAA